MAAWTKINFSIDPEKASSFIWMNSLIRVDNKPILWKESYKRDLRFVHQLYRNNRCIGFVEAWEKFGLTILQLNALLSAIPRRWKPGVTKCYEYTPMAYDTVIASAKPTRKIYQNLVSLKITQRNKLDSWEKELSTPLTATVFNRLCANIYLQTNSPKLRSFQYRLLQRALVLNTHLKIWGLTECSTCTFCSDEEETLRHLFCECQYIWPIWLEVQNFIGMFTTADINLSPENILFNTITLGKKCIANTICLIVKQYIYKQRCLKKPVNWQDIKAVIWATENVERYIAIKNNNSIKHQKKWYGNNSITAPVRHAFGMDEIIEEYMMDSNSHNLIFSQFVNSH